MISNPLHEQNPVVDADWKILLAERRNRRPNTVDFLATPGKKEDRDGEIEYEKTWNCCYQRGKDTLLTTLKRKPQCHGLSEIL